MCAKEGERSERVKWKQQIFLSTVLFLSRQTWPWSGRQTDRQDRSGSPSGLTPPLLWINPFTSPPLWLSPCLLFPSLLPLHVSPWGLPFAFVINRGMSWREGHLVFYCGSWAGDSRAAPSLFGALRGQNSFFAVKKPSTVKNHSSPRLRILTKIQQISDKCRVADNFFSYRVRAMSLHSGFPAHRCLCTPPGLLSP